MKNLFIPFALLLLVVTVTSCDKEEDPTEDLKYTLTVDNSSAHDFDLYLNANLDDTGFVHQGTVMAGQEKKIKDLVIAVEYTLRVAAAGEPMEDFFDEQNFTNSDPEEYDMKITISGSQ